MLSVSLFVGALALNMMFDMYTPRKHPQSALDWWSSKASIMLVFSIMESTIMLGLMMLINGLSPIHPFATWLLLTLTALLFMTIVAWLNLKLPNPSLQLTRTVMMYQTTVLVWRRIC
ncbi:hypothetical protein WP50_28825 [Lactiplantibacillus plantarum]|nr:hypothetical protein WP50_28825 [Lactiplantibacillus plantarum]